MIICHCNSVNSTLIKLLIDEGLTLDEIRERTCAGDDCGSCVEMVRKFYETNMKENDE